MKRLRIVVGLVGAGLLGSYLVVAQAQDAPSWMDRLKKTTGELVSALPMPSISLPSMPDFSMPDFTKMGDGIMGEFNAFTQQIAESLPILEEMGYEVATFRVQWGLPPKAKLRLRSKEGADQAKIAVIVARPNSGVLAKTLISSAAEAKRIQNTLKFGTAVLDVDFAVPPKVGMSFLKPKKDIHDTGMEDLDLACGQALN
jgi:hypothetical protein